MFKNKELIKVYNKLYKSKVKSGTFDHAAFYHIISEGLKSLIKQVKKVERGGEDSLIAGDKDFIFWAPYWFFSDEIMQKARNKFNTLFYDQGHAKDGEQTFLSILESSNKWNEKAWSENKINKPYQVENFFSFIWCGLILVIPYEAKGMGKYRYKSYINNFLSKYKILSLVSSLENEVNKWLKLYSNNIILKSIAEWIEVCFPEEEEDIDVDEQIEENEAEIKEYTGEIKEQITNVLNILKDLDNNDQEKNIVKKTLAINKKDDQKKEKNNNCFQFDLNFKSINNAKTNLTKSIIGQPLAIEKINEILINEMYSSGIGNSRPMGILFFVGPTGVGKTETIKELSKSLYGTDQIHRFDMSEYKSEVAIQKLIGAPNGYAGYDEGGTLTNAMQKNPNAIILFDEIEKADKTVFDLFLQLLDEGFVTSNKGVKSYFKNTIVVFTSNIGAGKIEKHMDYDEIKNIVTSSVEHFFNEEINRPEILGRIGKDNIVVFNLISKREDLFKIVDLQFKKFYEEYSHYNFSLDYNKESLYDEILKDIDKTKGARDIRNKFELFKKHLFGAFFKNKISKEDLKNLKIKINYNDGVVDIINTKRM